MGCVVYAGKPLLSGTAPGYVVGDCSWLWDSPCGEGDSHPDFFTQEIQELMPGNGVGQGWVAVENPGVVLELGKTNQRKTSPSGAVDEKYPKVQRGGMGKRSGRELIASFLDLEVV